MPPRLTKEILNARITEEGYTCLEYDVRSKKFKYVCPVGHIGAMRYDHWQRGVRCAKCAGNKKLTIEELDNSFKVEGYTLLSHIYKNSGTPLEIMCPKGHKYFSNFNNWQSGHRCPYCSGKMKKDLTNIQDIFNADGYMLLDNEYKNSKQPLKCICPNGHVYKVSFDNYNNKGSRCPQCSSWGVSEQEQDLRTFIKKHCVHDLLLNDRSLLAGQELDIVIPELKLAIEYCGLYWHSEALGKYKEYHLSKLDSCNSLGIKLITVFEDEWVSRKDITKSRLLSYIDSSTFRKVPARKCSVEEVSAHQARIFCEENHLQGYGAGAKVKLGLFLDDLMVSLMTFSKPSLSKGNKKKKEGVWELHRFCSKINTQVYGGASKLLKYFENNFSCTEIFSFADRRWSSGELYETLGFLYDYSTKPNYWYFKNNAHRIHRFNLRKPSGSDISERELRFSEGYNIIWDCGNLKYTKVIN